MSKRYLLVPVLAGLAVLAGCAGGTGIAPNNPGGNNSMTLSANVTSMDFGNVAVNGTKTTSFTLSSSASNTGTINISQVSVTGAGFKLNPAPSVPFSIAPGQSANVSVTFAPTTGGAVSGTVTVTSNAGNASVTIALTGSGMVPNQLAVSAASVSFGSVAVGSNKTNSLTLSNSASSTATIHVSALVASGTGFTVSSAPSLPITMAPGANVTVQVKFAPTAATAATGSLAITSDALNPSVTVSLSGTGTAAGTLSTSPTTQSFGSVAVGSSKNLTGTLTASNASVNVNSASWTGSGYSVSGITFPATVASGKSVSYTVTFAPTTAGISSGSISFLSNASNTPTAVALTGTGTQASAHTVGLSWTGSSSSVTGYFVYRGMSSGGPYSRLFASPQVGTSFTDSTVSSGTTYYYVTTAVDSNSSESNYSNEAAAAIP